VNLDIKLGPLHLHASWSALDRPASTKSVEGQL
jgi:hypothetical protein